MVFLCVSFELGKSDYKFHVSLTSGKIGKTQILKCVNAVMVYAKCQQLMFN